MISVLIHTLNAEQTLARVFAPLVGPTVRGLVREVLVLDEGSDDATLRIAEGAGADIIGKGTLELAGDWVLHLPQNCVLDSLWEEEARRLMESSAGQRREVAGLFRLLDEDLGRAARFAEKKTALVNTLTRKPVQGQALLAPSSGVEGLISGDPKQIAGSRPCVLLRSATTRLTK